MEGAEPYALPGDGELGAVLFHGFTGTPAEMRPLATALSSAGIAASAPLLSGHGTHPDDMLGLSYQRWLDDANIAMAVALQHSSRVALVGLSMGGLLALALAARASGDPRIVGIVSISAPLTLNDWRLPFAPLFAGLIKWQAWGTPDIKNVAAWDDHRGYRRFRSRAVLQLLGLMRETNARLADVRHPLLAVHSREDHVVPPKNLELLRDSVGSTDVETLWLENSYHLAPLDFDAPLLADRVIEFCRTRTGVSA
jgi:carboxylesterase